MDAREATKWLAAFAFIVGAYFLFDQLIGRGAHAFGITRAMRGEFVTVQAQVAMISGGKGHVFPILKDPSNQRAINAVLFRNDDAPEENLMQRELLEAKRLDGTLVTIEGKVEVYNEELEIIIGKVY